MPACGSEIAFRIYRMKWITEQALQKKHILLSIIQNVIIHTDVEIDFCRIAYFLLFQGFTYFPLNFSHSLNVKHRPNYFRVWSLPFLLLDFFIYTLHLCFFSVAVKHQGKSFIHSSQCNYHYFHNSFFASLNFSWFPNLFLKTKQTNKQKSRKMIYLGSKLYYEIH